MKQPSWLTAFPTKLVLYSRYSDKYRYGTLVLFNKLNCHELRLRNKLQDINGGKEK